MRTYADGSRVDIGGSAVPSWLSGVVALFLSGAVASGILTLIVRAAAPSLSHLDERSTDMVAFGFYALPVLVSTAVAAVVVPPLLREFARSRITPADAAFAVFVGVAFAAVFRFVVQQFQERAERPEQLTPSFYIRPSIAWLAGIVGLLISVWLIRTAAAKKSVTRGGYPVTAVSPVPLLVLIVGVVSLGAFVADRAHSRLGRSTDSGSSITRAALSSYVTQLEAAQEDVFAVVQAAAAGPAGKASPLLQSKSYSFRAHASSLDAAALFGNRITGVGDISRQLSHGFRSFSVSVRQAALLRTRHAQLRALVRAPALPNIHRALGELQRHLRGAGLSEPLVDQRRWSLVLRARRLP